MPKLKSNRGAAKRFRSTKNGFKCRGAFRRHNMSAKSMKQKRQLRACGLVAEVDKDSVTQMLPYGS